MRNHRIILCILAVLAIALLAGCAAPVTETSPTPKPEEDPGCHSRD